MFNSEWRLGASSADEALNIRREVLMNECGWPDEAAFDLADEYAAHLLIRVDGQPIASGRLIKTKRGMELSHVSVLKEYRGERYGDLCFRLLMDKSVNMGCTLLEVRTADEYVPYFLRFGFKVDKSEGGASLMSVRPGKIIWHSPCKDGEGN